ncbi:hypothetical protein HK102_007936, partial [Quaeritorhiza haematococci]
MSKYLSIPLLLLSFLAASSSSSSLVSATPLNLNLNLNLKSRQSPDSNSNCQRTITVKPGDTCWNLATTNHFTLDQFLAANPNID